MTVAEIMNQKQNQPLFPTNYNFMGFYAENYATIDLFIRIMYGSMKTIVDDVGAFDLLVGGYLNTQRDAIEKRYAVLRTEYNPIWNVDGTEKTESDVTRSGSITNLKSGNIERSDEGSIMNVRIGSVARENGKITTTTTDDKTSFESDTYVKDSQQTQNTDAFTTTDTYNNLTDTQTMNGKKNTETYNNVSDKQTFDNLKNVSRETLTRQGNIGVTSTQALITQELALRLNDFYMCLFSEILNVITYGWEV